MGFTERNISPETLTFVTVSKKALPVAIIRERKTFDQSGRSLRKRHRTAACMVRTRKQDNSLPNFNPGNKTGEGEKGWCNVQTVQSQAGKKMY